MFYRVVSQCAQSRRRAVGDHSRSPAGMRCEYAVVQDEVDPRPRGERRELLEQRERLEDELARAVRPGRLEREHDATVGQQPESILSDRRPEQIGEC
jgi:hypothetical protein